jgi:arylsulfatase A-like enzyme
LSFARGFSARKPCQNNRKGVYAHDLFTKESAEFIQRSQDKPFFLYLAYTLPHSELEVPEDSLKSFRGKFPPDINEPGKFASIRNPHEAFAAMVTRLDGDVGKLLALLKRLQLERDTLVIFTTDNGAHDVNGKDPAYFNSSGPLRGIKRDLYEGGIRVPFIARWPGKIKAGSTSNHAHAFWDFLPTAAEIAGVKAPANTDGISYLPALLGQPQRAHDFLYWELEIKNIGSQAVRMSDWKALRHGRNGALELYDLSKDLGEKNDVAAQHPAVVKKIEAYLQTAHVDSPDFPLWPDEEGKKKKKK